MNIVQTLKMIIMETIYKLEKYIWYNTRKEKRTLNGCVTMSLPQCKINVHVGIDQKKMQI